MLLTIPWPFTFHLSSQLEIFRDSYGNGSRRWAICHMQEVCRRGSLWFMKDKRRLVVPLFTISIIRLSLPLSPLGRLYLAYQWSIIHVSLFPLLFTLSLVVMSVHSYQDILSSAHWVSEPLCLNLVAENYRMVSFWTLPLTIRFGCFFIWWFWCIMGLSYFFELIWIFAQCPYVLIRVRFIK